MNFIKHPLVIFLGGALTLYVISGLVSGNWNPFASASNAGKVPILDANGKPTGGYAPAPKASSGGRSIACQKTSTTVGGTTYTGWIGDCKFPITGA